CVTKLRDWKLELGDSGGEWSRGANIRTQFNGSSSSPLLDFRKAWMLQLCPQPRAERRPTPWSRRQASNRRPTNGSRTSKPEARARKGGIHRNDSFRGKPSRLQSLKAWYPRRVPAATSRNAAPPAPPEMTRIPSQARKSAKTQ